MRNLHRIMGRTFQHAKAQCPACLYRRDYGEWEGYCTLRDKILSYTEHPGRCSDAATLVTQAAALRRRLERAWAVEQVNSRRAWRLFALVNRARMREMGRIDAAS